jgi:hypothetical protein
MRNWGEKIIGFFCNPRPTLFDLCAVIGIIGMGLIVPELKGLYFIFYSIFVVCIGFYLHPVYQSHGFNSLTLISLCGLSSLFAHSFFINTQSITFQYLNVYLMFEGYIYVFFGCLLFYTLATKARNLRLFILTLPLAGLGWIKYALHGGQMSIIIAMLFGFIVYLTYKRRFLLLDMLICLTLCVIAVNHKWLLMKFSLRPGVWTELCRMIWNHPFIGEGFNKFVGQDQNGIILWNSSRTIVMNCLYRHNDYLNIATLYGVPVLIGIALFIKEGIDKLKTSWMIAPFLAFCMLCFVQATMFSPDKALVLICSTAVFYTEN